MHLVFLREAMVDAAGRVPEWRLGASGAEPVGINQRIGRSAGQWNDPEQVARQRAFAAGGNDVAGEGRARKVGSGAGGKWIVDRGQAALAVFVSAEIAGLEGRGGHVEGNRGIRDRLAALISEPPESFVLSVVDFRDDERAAVVGAVLV